MIDRYENGEWPDISGHGGWDSWEPEDPRTEKRLLEQRKIEYRQKVRRLCSILGFSMAVMMVMSQLLGVVLGFLSYYLATHMVMGIGGELFKLLHSDWFSVAGLNLLSYALVLPVITRMMSRVPEVRAERKKMRFGKFIMFLVLAFGFGYLSNIAGSLINFFLSRLLGRSMSSLVPVNSLMQNLNWATVLYISVLGPMLEEYVFRWLLINRLRPLGEKAAILFSALMFGLMHGNIGQFFYAAAIGVVFGYIAVKTGRLIYTSILHIIFNSFSTLLAGGVLGAGAGLGAALYYILVLMVPVIMLGSMVAAIVLFLVNRRKTGLRRGNWPDGVEYRDFSAAMYRNPGVCLFTALCIGMACFYVFYG